MQNLHKHIMINVNAGVAAIWALQWDNYIKPQHFVTVGLERGKRTIQSIISQTKLILIKQFPRNSNIDLVA